MVDYSFDGGVPALPRRYEQSLSRHPRWKTACAGVVLSGLGILNMANITYFARYAMSGELSWARQSEYLALATDLLGDMGVVAMYDGTPGYSSKDVETLVSVLGEMPARISLDDLRKIASQKAVDSLVAEPAGKNDCEDCI